MRFIKYNYKGENDAATVDHYDESMHTPSSTQCQNIIQNGTLRIMTLMRADLTCPDAKHCCDGNAQLQYRVEAVFIAGMVSGMVTKSQCVCSTL